MLNDKPSSLSLGPSTLPAYSNPMLGLLNGSSAPTLEVKTRTEIADEVSAIIRAEFALETLRAPLDEDRERVRARVSQLVAAAVRRRTLSSVRYEDEQALGDEIARRLLGLGFLDLLLPPARRDISEIAVDPFGVIWIKRKGVREFEPSGIYPDLVEVKTVFDNLLGTQLKAASEANPSINAKLPRTKHNPGGGRIKYLHPVIVPGAGFPSVNIRLFEPEPVKPERLLEWGMLDEPTLDVLAYIVRMNLRGFICGGTSSGKTTLLSMLCNFLPFEYRIVTIEDPQEIWVDNMHVVAIEARPSAPGSELKPYLLRDGVDDAMRMTPDYLVVGEVRDGWAAQALFRAMMSDHPGMSTFHAEDPRTAVKRISLLLQADGNTSVEASREMFAAAVDWVVRIGFEDGRRRVFEIVEVVEELHTGQVEFRPLVKYEGSGRWSQLGLPNRQRGYISGVPRQWQEVLALDVHKRTHCQAILDRRRAVFRVV